jgi:hypothetical protein
VATPLVNVGGSLEILRKKEAKLPVFTIKKAR